MTSFLKNPTKYRGNEIKYLRRVVRAKNWSSTSGSWVNTLERAFAEKVGAKYGIAMNSGTSTLHSILEAKQWEPGFEVISPALSVIMNTTSTLHANGVPVYADVSPDTWTIDVADVQNKISPKTKAVMAVSLYGLPANLPALRQLCDQFNILLIEDNAQAVTASALGRPVGAWGDASSWSFESTKHISAGEGGMVTTNSEQLAIGTRKVAGQGYANLTAGEGRVRLNEDVFQRPYFRRHDTLGWNYRMNEFTAAVALAQLEQIDELVRQRRYAAELLLDATSDCDFLVPQNVPPGYTHDYYTLAFRFLSDKAQGSSWVDFHSLHKACGGDGFYGAWLNPYCEPIVTDKQFHYRTSYFMDADKLKEASCPIAEEIQPQLMQFKTNYRSKRLAYTQARSLREAIRHVRNGIRAPVAHDF